MEEDEAEHRRIREAAVLGKVYERLLIARLKFYLLPRMSTRQYSFMPQRSTEDALYDLMGHIRAKQSFRLSLG